MTTLLDVTAPTQLLVHLRRDSVSVRGLGMPCANRFHGTGELDVLRLAPDRALVVDRSTRGPSAALVTELAGRGDWVAAVTDVSAGQRSVRVHGPDAQTSLASACSIDLRAEKFRTGHCASTAFARVPVVLVRRGVEDFEIIVTTSLVEFVTAWLRETRCAPLA